MPNATHYCIIISIMPKNAFTKTTIAIISFLFLGSILVFQYAISQNQADVLPAFNSRSLSMSSVFEPLLNMNFKVSKDLTADFTEVIDFAKSKKGTFGIYVKDLENNKVYKYNETEEFYAASLYKTPVALATAKAVDSKVLTWATQLTYTSNDFFGGTGKINTFAYGTKFQLHQVFEYLLKQSDNSAQIMLTRTIPKKDVEQAFKQFLPDAAKSKYFVQNLSTPYEQAALYEGIYKDEVFLSRDSKKYLIETMSHTSFDDRVGNDLREGLYFAHKIGSWGTTGSWHDCGIIYGEHEYIVCIMSKNTTFENLKLISNELGKIF